MNTNEDSNEEIESCIYAVSNPGNYPVSSVKAAGQGLVEEFTALREQLATVRTALERCDTERLQLIDGIVQAEQMVREFADKYFDEDPPEGSEGSPQSRELRRIASHLSGTCIGDDCDYMSREKYKALAQIAPAKPNEQDSARLDFSVLAEALQDATITDDKLGQIDPTDYLLEGDTWTSAWDKAISAARTAQSTKGAKE